MPSCTGCTKPMAEQHEIRGISKSVPAMGWNFSSHRTHRNPLTLPFRPSNSCVNTAKSRSAPSSWLDEVRSLSGQSGHVSALFSFSGGFGMISKLVTDSAPWRIEVPMQSEPVSPPPMTTTCLPLGEDRFRPVLRFVADATILLGQKLHREMDAIEIAAGHRQVTRLLGAAGQHDGIVQGHEIGGRTIRPDMHAAMEPRRLRPPSARRAVRPDAFPS